MRNKKAKKGYTLLEVLVVVVIIGVLTYVSVPTYNRLINKSDVSDALHKIDMFSGAEGKYFIEHGGYTGSLGSLETPLKGSSAEISTTNYNYSLGDPHENNYCVYAESTSKNYVLGRNYKTNSEVLCSGADCGKIESFVKAGSLSELCGGNFNDECDLTCEDPKTLNEQKCACVCKTPAKCNSNQVLSDETCQCVCSPAAVAACAAENKVLLANCSCGCKGEQVCDDGLVFNPDTCKCEEACKLNDEICKKERGENFILSPKKCACVCGKSNKECVSLGLVLNKEKCICEEKEDTCTKTNEDCQEENGNVNFIINKDCVCECGISEKDCKEGEIFDPQKCICAKKEGCTKTDDECKKENDNINFIVNKDCACECGLREDSCNFNEIFNYEKCICEKKACDKTPEDCQELNPNFILNKDCQCECGISGKNCKKDETFNAAKCICEKKECLLSTEKCQEQNQNPNYVFVEEGCKCRCGLDEIMCKLTGQVFDSQNCACINACNLNSEKCQDQNPNFIFVKDDCKCLCGLDEITCKAQGKVLDTQNCECVTDCQWNLEKCVAQNPNFIFNEDHCKCQCGLTEEDCNTIGKTLDLRNCECTESCKWNLERCQEYYNNSNYIFVENGCRCECGLKASDCASLGLAFNATRCRCENSCSGSSWNAYACSKVDKAFDPVTCQCVNSNCSCVTAPGGCQQQENACVGVFGWTAGFFNYGTCECDAYGNYIN